MFAYFHTSALATRAHIMTQHLNECRCIWREQHTH